MGINQYPPAGSVSNIPNNTVSANPPAAPKVGDIWIDSDNTLTTTDLNTFHSYTNGNTGFRNYLINGDMKVWQRGTSTVFVQSDNYRADRWGTAHYQSANYVQQALAGTGDLPPCQYVLRVGSCTNAQEAGGSRGVAAQQIESANVIPLRNKVVTLSFYVRFSAATQTSAAGDWTFSISADSTADLDFGTTGPLATTVGIVTITNGARPTTWTRYTVTGTVPSNAGTIRVDARWSNVFKTTNAYDDWYEIACVQLEEGSIATPFEVRPYGMELALCQRYYYRTGNTAYCPLLICSPDSTTNARGFFPFPVTMRTPPTALERGGSNPVLVGASFSNMGYDRSTTNAMLVNVSGTGMTTYGSHFLHGSGDATTYLAVSAEL